MAASLGYVPSTIAASLVTGRTRNVGVIIPYLHRWFFAEVLEGIQSALLERGLDLTLYDANPGSEGRRRIFEDFLARKRFDGLIAVGLEPEDHELERLLTIGRPVVQRRRLRARSRSDRHRRRRRRASRRPTTSPLSATARSPSSAAAGPTAGRSVDRRRLSGYLAAMSAAGLAEYAQHVASDVTLPGGYAAAVDLLGDCAGTPDRASSRCATRWPSARSSRRARLGIRVPSDLSVVGIDDHEYAEMFALTTLRQVPRDQGRAAVELLEARLADPDIAHVTEASPARLIMRASTGPVDSTPLGHGLRLERPGLRPAEGMTKAPDAASGAFV